MDLANRFELHYYFSESDHAIDALVRNKCEAEMLAILLESAALLDIDAYLITEAYLEGGFRDIWKFIGRNVETLTLLVLIAQLVTTAAPLFNKESADLDNELTKLSIEEKKLQIEKLKRELKECEPSEDLVQKAANTVGKSLKVIKRRSNFYSDLEKYRKVEKVGFVALNESYSPVSGEIIVPRSDFSRFILSTNKLRSEEDENAVIEIISPVLKEGRYRWKGMYKEKPISFEMQDAAFRDSVLLENIPFQHGTSIECVLVINRELDEVGEVKITGYAVTTVIKKVDSNVTMETLQGKKYRYAKKLAESQGELFGENSNN